MIPGQEAKIPHASWPKTQNRSNIVTNSIKTFKMFHIKKKSLKNMTKMHLMIRSVSSQEPDEPDHTPSFTSL